MKNFCLQLFTLLMIISMAGSLFAQSVSCPVGSTNQSVWISNVKVQAFSQGIQSLQLDLSRLSKGIYFVRLESASTIATTKLVVL